MKDGMHPKRSTIVQRIKRKLEFTFCNMLKFKSIWKRSKKIDKKDMWITTAREVQQLDIVVYIQHVINL